MMIIMYMLKGLDSYLKHFHQVRKVKIQQFKKYLGNENYFSAEPFYLGKPSTSKPLEVFDIKAPQVGRYIIKITVI